MEEGFNQLLKILFLILVAIAILTLMYFLRDSLYEKTNDIKDIFSNLFSFS